MLAKSLGKTYSCIDLRKIRKAAQYGYPFMFQTQFLSPPLSPSKNSNRDGPKSKFELFRNLDIFNTFLNKLIIISGQHTD